jgi:hypothetical protein
MAEQPVAQRPEHKCLEIRNAAMKQLAYHDFNNWFIKKMAEGYSGIMIRGPLNRYFQPFTLFKFRRTLFVMEGGGWIQIVADNPRKIYEVKHLSDDHYELVYMGHLVPGSTTHVVLDREPSGY